MLDKFDKNKNPFVVPEGYFEGLTTEVLKNLPEKNSTVRKIPLWKKVIPWTGVAAAIAVGFFALDLFYNNEHKTTVPLKKTDAGYYVEDYYDFMEEESVEAFYYTDVLFDE